MSREVVEESSAAYKEYEACVANAAGRGCICCHLYPRDPRQVRVSDDDLLTAVMLVCGS